MTAQVITPYTTQRRDKLNWPTVIAFTFFHIGAIAALFMFKWQYLAVAIALHWVAICWGIGLGYHRLHTHRSYRVPKFVDYFLAVCGSLALEGGPIFWVATHRIHHQYSDKEGDPHTPNEGGWWAHILWMLFGDIHHSNTELMSKYAPDLAKDRFHVLLNKWHWVPLAIVGVALLVFGGLPMMLWGLCLRVVVGLHCTWLVNSATHMWGRRRFATRDHSRNLWWVALITFGEGWHNNHHAHPTSARHGLAWYELDITWLHVWVLRSLGIAKAVRVAQVAEPMLGREAA